MRGLQFFRKKIVRSVVVAPEANAIILTL